MKTADLIVYGLGILLSALSAAPQVIARWRTFRAIVRESRAPTPAEWSDLDAEIASNAAERDRILASKS